MNLYILKLKKMKINDFEKCDRKFVLKCNKCGCLFLPWKTLMVTLPQNGMKPFIYCPNCKNYGDLDNFKIN